MRRKKKNKGKEGERKRVGKGVFLRKLTLLTAGEVL